MREADTFIRHFRGKRGRGAGGETIIFGILKRGDKVYTDCYKGYDVLDVSGFIHHRINHSKGFADRRKHINGIENFWNQAKRVLRKYNGIDRKSFPLFLKECEFRFNFGTPSRQLKILRDWCRI